MAEFYTELYIQVDFQSLATAHVCQTRFLITNNLKGLDVDSL